MTLKATLLCSLRGKQGPQGLGTRAGSGLPSAITAPNAVDGDGYVDVLNAAVYPARSGGTWGVARTILGPTGDQGAAGNTAPSLTQTSAVTGQTLAAVTGVALTASYVLMPSPGTPASYPSFIPNVATTLVGATFVVTSVNTTSAAFQLVDSNTGTVYYTSATYGTGTINPVTNLSVSLPAAGKYQWMVKGSGSAPTMVLPVYNYPTTNGIAVGPATMAQVSGVTLTATPLTMKVYNSATAVSYFQNTQRNAYLHTATLANNTNASATFQLYNNTGGAQVAAYTVAANSTQQVGPLANGTAGITANNTHLWRITGTGTGSASVNWTVYS